MGKILTITADKNEGDYVTSSNWISDDELEAIRPLIRAIKNFKPYQSSADNEKIFTHNFPLYNTVAHHLGELSAQEFYVLCGKIAQEQMDVFMEFVPDEDGIHSITSITIREENPEEKLL